MLKPKASMEEFEKFGFKKCKGAYGRGGYYYLCVSRGSKMLLVSNRCFIISDWKRTDPRIHKKTNCRYRDKRDFLDIVYDLIKTDMLEKE